MNILVTGGAGFIGSSIVHALYDKHNVKVLDDLSIGVRQNLPGGVDLHTFDVSHSQVDIEEIFKDLDYIFHDAAYSSSPMFKNEYAGMDVNLMGFINVMGAAARNKVKKVIYASSSSIYNGQNTPFHEGQIIKPKTFYETSFYCREIVARTYFLEYGLESVGLRYFSVYGPNEKHKGTYANNISQFLWAMKDGKRPEIYGDGSQTRDFVFVDDVVRANILAMKTTGAVICNVGTGVSTSFNDVVAIINESLGTDIVPKYVKNPIHNYVQETQADTKYTYNVLGFKSRYSVQEGINLIGSN